MKGAVRGKYAKAYRAGHTVRVHKEDGSVEERHYSIKDGAVLLAPDVRRFFSDSEAVNQALRAIISVMPKRSRTAVAK